MKTIENEISHWNRRNISPLGRITVIKSLLLPKLTHLFLSLPNPSIPFIKQLNTLFFNFIWSNKNDRVARKLLVQPFNMGGCKMIDIEIFIKGLKLTWIRRILMDKKSNKWIDLLYDTQDLNFNYLTKFGDSYSDKIAKNMSNSFWKEVIKNLAEFQRNISSTDNLFDILRKPIWENSEIKIGGKCIRYDSWIKKGIILIQDLIDEYGRFYSYEIFIQKYNLNTAFTLYYGLKNCISEKWPIIEDCNQREIIPIRPKFIEILLKDKRGSRALCDFFLNKEYSKPKYERKWEESLYFGDRVDWKVLNNNVFSSTKDTKLIWFQYRIVHRIIATNKFLYNIKIKNDPLCSFCNNETETIEHLFYNCSHVILFWKKVEDWIKEKTNEEIKLSIIDVLFLKNNKRNFALNIMIILIKIYIFRKKFENKILKIDEINKILYNYYKLEKYIFISKGRMNIFEKRWNRFHELFC